MLANIIILYASQPIRSRWLADEGAYQISNIIHAKTKKNWHQKPILATSDHNNTIPLHAHCVRSAYT